MKTGFKLFCTIILLIIGFACVSTVVLAPVAFGLTGVIVSLWSKK